MATCRSLQDGPLPDGSGADSHEKAATVRERSAPELLAPAGDWECGRAAVANGADAVYFGLDCGFNARARAANFSLDDLPKLLAFLHHHGVSGYVTLNTLAFSSELESLEVVVRQVAAAGADAVLVQDLGLVRLIRRIAPSLPIHASTQMTLTSSQCVERAAALGVERVVLARELSVREIAKIGQQTSVPLEVFVHGALCVAYSGQCLTSETIGGRSANRGQCAQACRLPYELVCDGRDINLGDQKYLLSPQDLAAYALVPDLIEAGAMALKIEGRLKTPEYVANITRHYRQAIDSAMAGRPVQFTPRQIEELELSFSRGFSVGWLGGCDHKMLVPATSSAKRGVLVGNVRGVGKGRVQVELCGRLKAGDGVVFAGDRAVGDEQGGRVFALFGGGQRIEGEVEGGLVEIAFPRDALILSNLRIGQKLWKTDDQALTRRLRRTFSGEVQGRAAPVDVIVRAAVGTPLVAEAKVLGLDAVHCETAEPLAAALRHPLTESVLREQLGRLGGSGFALQTLKAEIIGMPMAPLSVLGKLRHALIDALRAARAAAATSHAVAPTPCLPRLRDEIEARWAGDVRSSSSTEPPRLHVLCRSLHQLRAALDHGAKSAYVDFQDIRKYRSAVALARAGGASIHLVTPRIQKPDEMGIFRVLDRHGADGMLVRNLSGLSFFTGHGVPCVADFSLNAANELTVDYLQSQGAVRVTPSYDLNRDQLLDLARHAPAAALEVVVHQHVPMFHMEHCVFCAVLSPGTNKTNCGRPCDDHEVRLRDRVGEEHPLKADVGCRNTLYNAVPQSGAEVVAPLAELGVRHFRVELLHDAPPAELQRTMDLYRRLLAGEASSQDVWRSLKAMNRVGVTRGTLEHERNPLAII